jgi:hypothetical protein
MALSLKMDKENMPSLASAAFYGVAGIAFQAIMAISGFPPHVGLIGIVSVITAYGLVANRRWAPYTVAILLFTGTTFALYTAAVVYSTDMATAAGLTVYAVLTWIFTVVALKMRQK